MIVSLLLLFCFCFFDYSTLCGIVIDTFAINFVLPVMPTSSSVVVGGGEGRRLHLPPAGNKVWRAWRVKPTQPK